MSRSERFKSVTFDDFSKGPWHSLGSTLGPKRGYVFDSCNMHLYSNGTLGPRPWIRQWTKKTPGLAHKFFRGAGIVHKARDNDVASGLFIGYGAVYFGTAAAGTYNVSNAGRILMWALYANGINDSQFSQSTVTFGYDFSIYPVRLDSAGKFYSKVLFLPVSDTSAVFSGFGTVGNVNTLSTTNKTLTAIAYASGVIPDFMIKHKNRYWVWGDDSDKNRIWWSGIGGTSSWNSLDYFDVGPAANTAVMGCYSLLNGILIVLNSHEWFFFSYSGAPGSGTVKPLGKFPAPISANFGVNTGDTFMYLTEADNGIYVASASGVDTDTLDMVRPVGDSPRATPGTVFFPKKGATALHEGGMVLPFWRTGGDATEVFYRGGEQQLEYVNGVWVRNLLFNNPYGPSFSSSFNFDAVLDTDGIGDKYYAHLLLEANDGIADTSARKVSLATRDAVLNRPSRSDDVWSTSQENTTHLTSNTNNVSSGMLAFPMLRPEMGNEIRPDKVILDIDYWNNGSLYAPIGGDVRIRGIDPFGEITTSVLPSLSTLSLFDTSGIDSAPLRVSLPVVPDTFYSRFQVLITGIRSFALRQLTVVYEERSETVTQQL